MTENVVLYQALRRFSRAVAIALGNIFINARLNTNLFVYSFEYIDGDLIKVSNRPQIVIERPVASPYFMVKLAMWEGDFQHLP